MENQKYYCGDNFDSWSWKHLIREVLPNSQFVEFNQLFLNEQLPNELEWLNEFRVNSVAEYKIYQSGPAHRFELTKPVKDFVLSKDFQDWRNTFFEDISFFNSEGTELLATVSHENNIVKLLTKDERTQLKEKGIDFWCSWGTLDEVKSTTKRRNRKSIFKSIMDMLWAAFG